MGKRRDLLLKNVRLVRVLHPATLAVLDPLWWFQDPIFLSILDKIALTELLYQELLVGG